MQDVFVFFFCNKLQYNMNKLYKLLLLLLLLLLLYTKGGPISSIFAQNFEDFDAVRYCSRDHLKETVD